MKSDIWRDDLTEAQLAVMRRAGVILVMIGVLDIVSCFIAVSRGASYSSSLNVFALVAGILIYRGSARAARLVVKGLSFLLGGFLLLPALMLVVTPWRLLLLQLRLAPWSFISGGALFVVLMAVLYWVRHLLGGLAIHIGGERARPLHRSVAAWVGACIPVCLAIAMPLFMQGTAGRRAVAQAQRQVGPGYSFYVQRLNTSGASGSALVVAYSDSDMREVEVEWHDK